MDGEISYSNIDPRTGKEKRERFVTVATAEKWWIEQARLRPDMFIHYMIGKKPARHHMQWLAAIFDFRPETRKDRIQIVAPRESAKTTIMVYSLVWFIARFPFLSNAIVSVSSEQSKKRMGMIRDIIEHDPAFKNVFGWIKIDKRQTNNINQFSVFSEALFDPKTNTIKPIAYNVWRSLLKRLGSLKDPTLVASSLRGKAIIGARYSGIVVLDDIVDHNYLKDSLQEDVYKFIMETLVPCLQENAKLVNIMTRWMVNDVADRLSQNPSWYALEMSAIFTDANGQEQSYWPEFFSLERLHEKREEMGVSFEVMYMNNPMALTSNKFNAIFLTEKCLPDDLPLLSSVYIGTDFGIETGPEHDFSVFVAIGTATNGDIFILDYARMKTQPDVTLTQLASFAHNVYEQYGRLDNIIIENVGFQAVMKYNLASRYSHLPAVPFKPMGGKDHRMDLFARMVNDGEIFFNIDDPIHKELVRECLNYPNYQHDDIADAITIVLQWMSANVTQAKLTMVTSPFLL